MYIPDEKSFEIREFTTLNLKNSAFSNFGVLSLETSRLKMDYFGIKDFKIRKLRIYFWEY